jgi:hypothetical protein
MIPNNKTNVRLILPGELAKNSNRESNSNFQRIDLPIHPTLVSSGAGGRRRPRRPGGATWGGDGVEEGGCPAGWGRDGGARSDWDGEAPGTPKNAAMRPFCCKMQHLLRLLLGLLQCASDLHPLEMVWEEDKICFFPFALLFFNN